MTIERIRFCALGACLLGMLAAFPDTARATSVIGLVDYTRNRIVVAADSRVVYFAPTSQTAIILPSPACKIVVERSCVVGLSGILQDRRVSPPFDLSAIAVAACLQGNGAELRDNADYFVSIAQPQVTRLLEFYKTSDPENYRRYFQGTPVTHVMFAGNQDNDPKVIIREFTALGGIVRVTSSESHRGDDDTYLGSVGVSDGAVIGYTQVNSDWDGAVEDLDETAAKFIELEIQEHPGYVGPPISVLDIDVNGPHWFRRGACK